MQITDFSKHLFWDVDISTISFEKHKEYIVQRVLEYGLMKDFVQLINYFSLNQVKDIAINLRSLDDRTLNFIATITNTPLQDFRCYTLKQSQQTHWIS
jgi:hypothetical protein